MGDRAVFGFKSEGHILFLYSHWGGDEQLLTMQQAIRTAEPRWGDPDYATRIAVSHIVGVEWPNETGYGLSIDKFAQPDYPYAYVVDWETRTVETIDTWREEGDTYTGQTYTFDKFLSLVNQEV